MLKKIQKIIIFTVIVLTVCVLMSSWLLIYMQQDAYMTILADNNINIDQAVFWATNIKNIYLVVSSIFVIVSILVGIILSKTILAPTLELVKRAGQIIRGESLEVKYLNAKKDDKDKDQIDDLVEMFAGLDSNLKEKLVETTRQKNEIETIIMHLTDGVISFDIHGNITLINKCAIEALNISKDDNFHSVCQMLDVSFGMEKIIYMENLTKQNKIINKNGKTYKVLFAPLKTSEEKADGIIIVLQDITEHVKLDIMRKQFVANVSHELKTPITSIMGYSDTILEQNTEGTIDKDQVVYFVSKISKEANRMTELVQDLLTLSKYEVTGDMQNIQEFDLSELVKELVDRLKHLAQEKDINIKCLVTADIPNLVSDKEGIERVITNIITNAIKYTLPGGNVDIYIGFLYNDAYVKIKDTGIGIEKEDLPRVFERFYRVDSSRVRKTGGTGLGLSIAKEIMEKCGGTIDLKSEFGRGTEVILRFPIKKDVEQENE